jgi:dienelactone hydrolase
LASRLRGDSQFTDGAGSNFLGNLAEILERKVPVLFLYGDSDDAYEEFERAKTGRLGELLDRGASLVKVAVIPGRAHAFSTVRAQDAAMERIVDWLTELRMALPEGE